MSVMERIKQLFGSNATAQTIFGESAEDKTLAQTHPEDQDALLAIAPAETVAAPAKKSYRKDR